MKYFLIILSVLFIDSLFAQTQRGGYCGCKSADHYVSKDKMIRKDIYAITKKDSSNIIVSIINPTKDTLFLFSSYLYPQFYGSKHLHKVNIRAHIYNVSFLSIIPHLFVKYADNITGDPIMGQNQVVYDFIKLPPNSKQDISINVSVLTERVKENNNVSEDYDVKKLHKYTKDIPTKYRMANLLKSKLHKQFEFAIYQSVNLLCDQMSFYTNEYAFDQQSKAFKILTVPFQLNAAVQNKK